MKRAVWLIEFRGKRPESPWRLSHANQTRLGCSRAELLAHIKDGLAHAVELGLKYRVVRYDASR